MLEKYDWIANEKQYFGQENTAYDFQANDPKDAAKQLTRLNETKEKLGKSVNMRAMNMLGKAEEKVLAFETNFFTHSISLHLFRGATVKISSNFRQS